MLTIALAMMMGCTSKSYLSAPFDAQVRVPSDVILGWTDQLNRFDLSGTPVLVNIGVVDSEGVPMENIAVDVTSGGGGVYLLPQEAVKLVGYPDVPDNIQSMDDVRDACVDENGNYALVEEWCAWFWDPEGGQFYQFNGTYASNFSYTDTGYYYFAPNFATVQTNGRGIAELIAFVDSVPLDGTSYASIEIAANIGFSGDSFNITFTGESEFGE